MHKKSLLLLGAILLSAMDPLNFFTASATDTSRLDDPLETTKTRSNRPQKAERTPLRSTDIPELEPTETRPFDMADLASSLLTKIRAFDMPDSDLRELKHIHTRPPLTIQNATDCPLAVIFTPRTFTPRKISLYVWEIAPKEGGKTYRYEKLFDDMVSMVSTEENRYGTLTVYQWVKQKRYCVFGGLVDTSAFFSIDPKSACFYSLEQDETSGGTTAPKWLVEDVKKELVEKLTGAPSLFNQALEKLRIKCATMTPEEKEKPYTVGFPPCLHNPNVWLPPLPSSYSYLLRPAQTEDLRRQLDDFFPTEDEILAAEKAFMAEGIKIYHGANPLIRSPIKEASKTLTFKSKKPSWVMKFP